MLTPSLPVAPLPTGPTVAAVLDAACRELGVGALSAGETAHLPPWTDEEADAFRRVIDEAFERVEESPRLP